jgi:methylenetetrahydrofolate dehydrogenase (NADP+)/methenyltetrahydrofolate cyclohydrolase
MSARILDGTAIAAKLRHQVANRVRERVALGMRPPGLAVVLVGDDPASEIYVRLKHRDCLEVGIRSEGRELPATTSEAELLAIVRELNANPAIDGILVQLPLPDHVDASRVLEAILPDKDVDGSHPFNIGRLALRQPVLRSCTPKGIMQLLDHTGIAIRGLNATVVGASNHVGRPMGLELLLAGCTVTTAHKFTERLEDHVRTADVLVAAAGRPGLVRGEWVKPGAIVIDVGITRDPAGKLQGDVDFPGASARASWISPVPGGVGPMTRIAMLQNTLYAADHFHAGDAGGANRA